MDTLSWEILKRHIDSTSPSILNMGGTRGVKVGYENTKGNLFLRLPADSNSTIPPIPYSEINVEIGKDESGLFLEISTQTESLFSEFHRFAEIVTEIYEQPRQTAYGAFSLAIKNWKGLTSTRKLLTIEQQLGLYGELHFLRAIIQKSGAQSVLSWTGRNPIIPDRHDFRINSIDLEIKTTKSNQRIHIIHGLEQLQPSPGCSLFILSIKLQNAGLGFGISLSGLVEIIRKNLQKNPEYLSDFEIKLDSTGYKDCDSEHYQENLTQSAPPMIIEVDKSCPKITRETISSSLSSDSSSRINQVMYRVNFEGLGNPLDSEIFRKVLGDIQL